ncbi:MAG: response regulator [Candidatus Kerfeldbacteria bacterium]|nr:response regulator [Candidatus Kerfeldbacteria bacterium]
MVRKKVLVVEDDQFLAKALRLKFGAEGYDVAVAENGSQAMDLLSGDPPQAVLLDLMLPGVSGFDVLAAIRANERWRETPVVIMSNLGQSQEIDRGMALGATDYIIKANVRLHDVVGLVSSYSQSES